MPAIPNPNNGYIPKEGEIVRIVGSCHPRMMNKLAYVIDTTPSRHTIMFFDDWNSGEIAYTSGYNGGCEPVDHLDSEEYAGLRLAGELELIRRKKLQVLNT